MLFLEARLEALRSQTTDLLGRWVALMESNGIAGEMNGADKSSLDTLNAMKNALNVAIDTVNVYHKVLNAQRKAAALHYKESKVKSL